MIKQLKSWWKDSNIPNLIARKKVDFSIFEGGTRIPEEFHIDFNEANQEQIPPLGTNYKLKVNPLKRNCKILIRSQLAEKHSKFVMILIMSLSSFLFHSLKQRINILRPKESILAENRVSRVPNEKAEYITFYATGTPFEYRIKLITKQKLPNIWWVNQGSTIAAGKVHLYKL